MENQFLSTPGINHSWLTGALQFSDQITDPLGPMDHPHFKVYWSNLILKDG